MPTFGQNLQRLREHAGFRTAKRLADALGVVPSVVSKMENDQQGLPEGPTLLRLAKALRCSVDDLLTGVDPDYHPARATSSDAEGNHEADILDPAAANALRAARETLDERHVTSTGAVYDVKVHRTRRTAERAAHLYDPRDGEVYAIALRGDSMEPVLKSGVRLLVSPTHVVNDGDLAYVQLKSGERLVKLVTRHKSGLWLSAANPAYPPRFAANDQVVIVHRVVYASFVPLALTS
jgi:phage repressor protein C with HTH and peptisase S24 domain